MEENSLLAQPETADRQSEYISVDDMAKRLGVARATAYQLTKVSGFPCFYIGKRIIIPLIAFNDWTAKQAENQAVYLEK
ncbi:MAG: helix-turn-helix domain-containing protein [Eubacteriales bacterium]|nr:helix-turn-helix domain-containing protein [Eubacteriales bacterium]